VIPGRFSFAKTSSLNRITVTLRIRYARDPSRSITSRLKSFLHACVPAMPFHTQPISGICRVNSYSHNPDPTKPGAYCPAYFSGSSDFVVYKKL